MKVSPLFNWTFDYESNVGYYTSEIVRRATDYGWSHVTAVTLADYAPKKAELRGLWTPLFDHIPIIPRLPTDSIDYAIAARENERSLSRGEDDSQGSLLLMSDNEKADISRSMFRVDRAWASQITDVVKNNKLNSIILGSFGGLPLYDEVLEAYRKAAEDPDNKEKYVISPKQAGSFLPEDLLWMEMLNELVNHMTASGLEVHWVMSFEITNLLLIPYTVGNPLSHMLEPRRRHMVLMIIEIMLMIESDSIIFDWEDMLRKPLYPIDDPPPKASSSTSDATVDDAIVDDESRGEEDEGFDFVGQANVFFGQVREKITAWNASHGTHMQVGLIVNDYDARLELTNLDFLICTPTGSMVSASKSAPESTIPFFSTVEDWGRALESSPDLDDVALYVDHPIRRHLEADNLIAYTNPSEIFNQIRFTRTLLRVKGMLVTDHLIDLQGADNLSPLVQSTLAEAVKELKQNGLTQTPFPPQHKRLETIEPRPPSHVNTEFSRGYVTTTWIYDPQLAQTNLRYHVIYAIPGNLLSSIDKPPGPFASLDYVVARVTYAQCDTDADDENMDSAGTKNSKSRGNNNTFTAEFHLPHADYMLYASSVTRAGTESKIANILGQVYGVPEDQNSSKTTLWVCLGVGGSFLVIICVLLYLLLC